MIVGVKNRCPLTPIVSKTSSGALEFQDIYCVENTAGFLTEAKDLGYRIIAADSNPSDYPENIGVSQLQQFQSENRIIILGSEGAGVSDHIRRVSDMSVSIRRGNPMLDKFPYSLVDSLNVSVASGIILQSATNGVVADRQLPSGQE